MVHWPEQSTADGEKHGALARTIYSRWERSMVHWPEQSTVGGRKAWCLSQNNLQ